jgi:parvulin-like peptidyl-prolyl isomerase
MTKSPDERAARRSLLLCALGATLGLVIAGVGLFTAKGTRTAAVPPEDVALVNAVPILMSDYLIQLRALYDVSLGDATPQQRRKVLDDMIQEELYVQRGVELGLQADTIEVRTALVGAVEAQIAADATTAQPDEAELQAFYRAHIGSYASEGLMALDDFLITPMARDPSAAAAALRQGVAAAQLGLVRTSTMTGGEEFYFAARIHLGETLFACASRLRAGEVSAPVTTGDGVHLLVMKSNKPPVPRSYEEARGKVLQDFIDDRTKALAAGNARFLRKRADIVVAPGFQ